MPLTKRSWVESANDPASGFPIQNLPYGVFTHQGATRIGVAIGDSILDLRACTGTDLFAKLSERIIAACRSETLNALMSLGPAAWSELRRRITAVLDADNSAGSTIAASAQILVPMREASMRLPACIGDYSDFYASIHHATRVGKLFRPDSPLLPNYKHVPIGYHGRASSIVVSGTPICRPNGQTKPVQESGPLFGPSRSLDYELEVGMFIGSGNPLGRPIPIAEAEDHIFGLCLLNDWSARDIQSWEYQPLGPFLAKSFATSISPWIVPLEALAPYRVPSVERPAGDPAPLPYLSSATVLTAIDLHLEVFLQSQPMRDSGIEPMQISRSNLRDLYWTPAQLLAHHASNGCNLRPGDLLGTGTISGSDPGSEGCLLERRHNPEPVRLPSGETRTYLEDGDTVTLRGYALKEGLPRIGFGECTGTII